jgi:S1/P1 Nuclease
MSTKIFALCFLIALFSAHLAAQAFEPGCPLPSQLTHEFATEIPTWRAEPANLESWAWDSHQLAVDTSYGKLPKTISVESPHPVSQCTDDNNVSKRMKKLNEAVSQTYVDAASPVIRRQLAKAGSRLATLLNDVVLGALKRTGNK